MATLASLASLTGRAPLPPGKKNKTCPDTHKLQDPHPLPLGRPPAAQPRPLWPVPLAPPSPAPPLLLTLLLVPLGQLAVPAPADARVEAGQASRACKQAGAGTQASSKPT